MLHWPESVGYELFLGAAVKSLVVLGLAWLAAILLRRRSAAARHLAWTAAAAALLALPLLSLCLPGLRVPLDRSLLPVSVAFRTTALGARILPSSSPSLPQAGAALPPATPRGHSDGGSQVLLTLWGLGTFVAFAHMGFAWAAAARVRRRAPLVGETEVEPLARQLGISRDLPVLEARAGSMPMTQGLLRPAILLPADAAGWSAERRRIVLLHELAHVRRGDIPKQLLARIALNFCWWNPLAWIAWREFLKEREHAADDLVLAAGIRASDYAGHLLEIARSVRSSSCHEWAVIAMARQSHLEHRLRAILDNGLERRAPGRLAALAAGLLVVAVVAPLAALQSQDVPSQVLTAEMDATVRAASAQRNPAILDRAASAAITLRQYETARKLLEASLALRAEVSGPQSVEYALGLSKLGQLARAQPDYARAEDYYRQALSVLGARPEAAAVLIDLGTLALLQKENVAAIDYLERARAADPAKAPVAMTWMAIAQERQNNPAEAGALYQGALQLAAPSDAATVTTLELYAEFLARQGREKEAKPLRERAAALRGVRASQAVSPSGAPAADVYRVGNGVTRPVLVTKVEPQYTEEARIAGYEGTAVLYAEITPDGLANNLKVLRGVGLGLNDKAVEAIRQWKFKPGTRAGQPVTVAATIEVNFRLY